MTRALKYAAILGAAAIVAVGMFYGRAPGAEVVRTCTDPYVLDGDTIDCGGRVRIFGVNSPEIAHPGKPGEPGGYEAKARMQALARGFVTCTPAGNQHDRYGRMVARCGTRATPDLGAQMLREGQACEWIRYSRHAYAGLGRPCSAKGK